MPSPWSNMDEYDPQLHGEASHGYWLADNKGQPKGHPDWRPWNAPSERIAPAAARWLGLLIVLAIVCAVVALMGGVGTLPMVRP